MAKIPDYKDSVAALQDKVPVQPKYFKNLPPLLRKRAFSVSNIRKLSIINAILDSLAAEVTNGPRDFKEWSNDLSKQLNEVEGVGAGAQFKSLSDAHLSTIYRNALNTAYNDAKYQQALDNIDFLPYMEYVSQDDDRTRPTHAALNGVIKKVDDPFWQTHTAPLGHNCRCTVITLTESEAKEKGVTKGEPKAVEINGKKVKGGPDKGWGSKQSSAAVEKRILKKQIKKLPKKLSRTIVKKLENSDKVTKLWFEKNKDLFRY